MSFSVIITFSWSDFAANDNPVLHKLFKVELLFCFCHLFLPVFICLWYSQRHYWSYLPSSGTKLVALVVFFIKKVWETARLVDIHVYWASYLWDLGAYGLLLQSTLGKLHILKFSSSVCFCCMTLVSSFYGYLLSTSCVPGAIVGTRSYPLELLWNLRGR